MHFMHKLTICSEVNPLDSNIATSNNTKLVHWPLMGGLLHLLQRGGAWAAPPSPLLAAPNITAHPSTASVPITVLLYCDVRRLAVSDFELGMNVIVLLIYCTVLYLDFVRWSILDVVDSGRSVMWSPV